MFEFVGNVTPPSDLTRQQVLSELQFWRLNSEPYLQALEEDSRVRSYVEPPVEVSLDQLPPAELLDALADLTPAERLRTDFEFVRHTDTDLIEIGLTDLESINTTMEENDQLCGSEPHIEILSALALGHYRMGRLSKSRHFLARVLAVDPENRQAKGMETLLNDTSLNYSRLGLLTVGLALVGLAALKGWTWAKSNGSKSRK